MTDGKLWYQDLAPTAADEAGYIVREFARVTKGGVTIGGVRSDHGNGVGFMYAEGQFLAREQYLDEIQEKVQRLGVQVYVIKRVVLDIVLLGVIPVGVTPGEASKGPDASEGNEGEESTVEVPSVLTVLDLIDAELGAGIATPDHVATVANGDMTPCPATEPQEVYGKPKPYPPVCPGKGGAKVRIYIADTGMLAGSAASHKWLKGIADGTDPQTEVNAAGETIILPYGGHGTFVTGVIRAMAPGTEIMVDNVFYIAGSALESDFVPRLNAGLKYGAEIFHLTIASATRHNRPMIAFEAWLKLLHQHKGVVCVVAAGNNGTRFPCWPAAFPGVISVGALATDWCSRAYFSNYGGWVDVFAPGQNLVNAYGTGTYYCYVAPYKGEIRNFFGMAQWSGTSFSTPIVTGLIAARMARYGESGQEAAAALLAKARAQAIPGVGAVLLPGCDDDDECRCDGCGRCRETGCGSCGSCGSRGSCGSCGRGRLSERGAGAGVLVGGTAEPLCASLEDEALDRERDGEVE